MIRICAPRWALSRREFGRDPSSIPRQLALSPMRVFAIGIEHALAVSVQGPHDADPREHRRAADRRDQEQRFDRCLPFLDLLFGLRKLLDMSGGILESDELAAAGQRGSGIGSSNSRFQPRSLMTPALFV